MFNIRRGIVHVCVLCLWISVIVGMAFPNIGEAETFYRSSQSVKYAVGENVVWIIEGDSVNVVQMHNGRKVPVATVENIIRIAAVQNNLVYVSSANESQTISMIDSSGHSYFDVSIPADFEIQQIEVDAERIFILGNTGDAENAGQDEHGHVLPEMFVYQMVPYVPDSFEKLNIDGWNNAGITSISVYDRRLYTYSAKSFEASVIDLTRDELVYPSVGVTNLTYITPANEIDNTAHLYSLCYNEKVSLWLVNMSTGEKTKVDADLPDDCYGLRRSRDKLYTLDSDGKTLLSIPIETGNKKKSITIINPLREDTQRMSKAIELFHMQYPDIEIAYQWVDDPRVLSTGIMSGAEGYDIICVQEHMSVTSSAMMYKAGAIENLSEYEEIVSILPEFLDMFGPVSIDGHLYGVPEMVLPYLWEVDPAVAAKIAYDIPAADWTWYDFFELAERVAQYNKQSNDPIVLLYDPNYLPYYLIQYNANTVDVMSGTAGYNDEEFIGLLTKWQLIYNAGLVVDTKEMPTNVLFKTCATDYYGMKTRALVLPPVFDETTLYPMEYVTMELNSNSSNKEEAAYFLACYMAPEVLLSEPIDGQGQWLKEIDRYARLDIQISAENEELWRTVLARGTQDYFIGDLYRDQGNILYPQLLAGEITAEQFAQACQRRANMVLGE